ncbi:IclR family transcriptional regulator [Nocardioides sp. SOB77]|uniref:IclR family transcriptional regulator n=1 Tax=Nocardioides oceani TaxID=3058369 RepID=A0ABT8FBK1_9ACTN|nr:IclR family transcriptional regulator [Nocardioides oceani]MDN4172057.1 IclR family transcriptional regulator [Nocardioides oceani]
MATVELVGKATAVLRAVAACEPSGASTTEVARRTGLPRATAHRLLHALADEGFLDRAVDARWTLGPEAYLLGVAAAPRHDVSARAQPVVRELALATGESAFYSVRRGAETVCLIAEEGSFPLRSHVLHVGKRFPLGVASAGLIILALVPEPEAARHLEHADLAAHHGPAHATPALADRLAEARRVGYAVNPGLVVEGSWGLAAAVLDDRGRPVGALSLTGVESRFPASRVPELGALLMRAAHRLGTDAPPSGARAR